MLSLIIRLSALSFGLCYATLPSAHLPPSQALTSLNERMNEMINALYASSPVLSKLKAAASGTKSTETTTTEAPPVKTEYDQYYQLPVPITTPQMVYLPTPTQPKTLEAGVQPTDYAYPMVSNPVPRSVFPPMPFPVPSYPTAPYPCEYPHSYPEYPVFPTPYLPPVPFPPPSPIFAPCQATASAPFPPTTQFSQATPSYTQPPSYAQPSSFPMTSYQSFPAYQSSAPPNYQQPATNYPPPAPQGETNTANQYS